jgi:hypothetical protein
LNATGSYHLRPFGRPLIEGFFGGRLAHELEAAGPGAFFDFAVAELVGLFGSDIRARLRPLVETNWARDPFARGSYSYALPGHADARVTLATPLDGRVFFCRRGVLAAPLPEEFMTLRRLLEARMGKQGKREFVQVLRLMEKCSADEVACVAATDDAGINRRCYDESPTNRAGPWRGR